MPLNVSAYNLSTGNKWILALPYKSIDPELGIDNISLNLSRIRFPDLSIGEAEFHLRGRGVPVPTGVEEDDKFIQCSFMLSENWDQYRLLYKWFLKFGNREHGTEPLSETLVDIPLFILSAYKTPLFAIVFKQCWIQSLGGFDLSYQDGEDNIETFFKFKYMTYEFEDLIEE